MFSLFGGGGYGFAFIRHPEKKIVIEYIKHLACNKEGMFRIQLVNNNHDVEMNLKRIGKQVSISEQGSQECNVH